MKHLCLLTLLALCYIKQSQSKRESICYYRNYAQYKKGVARFVPEDIDPRLCTVVAYAALKVDLVTHKLGQSQWNDVEMLQRISNLKKINPDMKVHISVGGWAHEYKPRFSHMVEAPETRATFIKSVLQYLILHNLDGISLDWEYPSFRGSPKIDRHDFSLLLKEMSEAFDGYAKRSGKPRFRLTIATSASKPEAYEIDVIVPYVDWINVMAYNLHGPWRPVTGCATRTRGKGGNTVPRAIQYYLDGGMPAEKINLGLANYGKSYTLKDANHYGIGDEITGKGKESPYTKYRGVLSYYEICELKWEHVTSAKDSSCGTPYASEGTFWTAYEDPQSIIAKIESLVNGLGLNGISTWALDFDDFRGTYCKQGKYPLLKAAVDAMK